MRQEGVGSLAPAQSRVARIPLLQSSSAIRMLIASAHAAYIEGTRLGWTGV